MQGKQNMMIKRIVDVCMTVLLLCLMAYQITGEVLHEWIGMGMTALVIIHQILNRKWYGAIFKGNYNPYRIVTTVVNIALLLSFALTSFCGMSMSGHAVPFLYGMTKVSFARRMHLSMSHWAFVLMGLHLGMHIPVMFARLKLTDRLKTVISGGTNKEDFGGAGWSSFDTEVMTASSEEEDVTDSRTDNAMAFLQIT
ncbi:DUF4405 domain-containing protein [Butyrivibrio sp. FC2001]|uniref:DUF4405 domain-containing protein n=1 Tax=Butyrivibrio sp. FC2001 TaxID=1280671 RepID=UPI00040D8251|nr:DUF4405 domain-containing protein [Butyrivibrio sp. FC2001]